MSHVFLTEGSGDYAFLIQGKSITIDLNGYSIRQDSASSRYTSIIATKVANSPTHLILRDSSENKQGSIYTIGTPQPRNINAILIWNDCTNSASTDDEIECSITFESGTYHAVSVSNGDGMIYNSSHTEIENGSIKKGIWVKGGTFILDNVGDLDNGSPWLFNCKGQNVGKDVLITGGTFNSDIQNQSYIFEMNIPQKYALKNNGDGTYTIVDAVCYVNVYHKSGNWYEYPYGCESFEKALGLVDWGNVKVNEGKGDTITMIGDCCINDLDIPENVEFNLKSEGTLYALPNTDTSGLKVHFIPQDGDNCTLHISSSPYECISGYCINDGCGASLPPVRGHSYNPSITCIVQECEECGTEISRSTDHDYEIIGNQKICTMCGDTIQLPSQDGTGPNPPGQLWPNNQNNQTTQNSGNQLEVSDIVTGTMVVIAVSILGMIIFDVVRKP